jgi:hypothetical protein
MRYFENYGREREAQTKYAALAADRRASHCAHCLAPCAAAIRMRRRARGMQTFLCRQRAPFLEHRPLAGFFTGGFLKDTGPADDVAFSNVRITYRF